MKNRNHILLLLIVGLLFSAFQSSSISITNQNRNTVDISVDDTGFLMPSETLFSSEWGSNSTNNPLGLSNRDAIFSSSTNKGNYLKGVDYNFNVPKGSTIQGIEVMIEHATWNGNNYYANISVELEWNGQTSQTSTGTWDYVDGKVNSGWNDNFRNVTLGSPTDNWGHDWTTTDLENGNFAVRISLLDVYPGASESVDIAWVKIYYAAPPEPASISLSQIGDIKMNTSSLSSLSLSWDVNFSYGDYTGLQNYVLAYLLVNGTEYNKAEAREYVYNNTSFDVDANSSIYQSGAYVGSFGQLLNKTGLYNLTLVTILYDQVGNFVVEETSSLWLDLTDGSTTAPTEPTIPSILVDFADVKLTTTLEKVSTTLYVQFVPIISDPDLLNYSYLEYDIYLNDTNIVSSLWSNNTVFSFDAPQFINSTGLYNFSIVLRASDGYEFITRTIHVQVTVVEKTTTTETSTETSDTTNTDTSSTTDSVSSPTNATSQDTDSVVTPSLNLDSPSLLIVGLSGFMVAIVRRRRN